MRMAKNPYAFAFELGFTIVIPILGFLLLGRFADRYFDSAPVGLLVGIVLSMPVVGYLLFRKAKDALDSEDQK